MFKILISILVILFTVYSLWFIAPSIQAQALPPTLEEAADALIKELPQVKLLPGQALYFLKTIKEKIEIFTTFGAPNKAKLFLKFAEKRLAEYQTLRAQGKEELAQRALEMYTQQLDQAIKKLTEAEKQESLEEMADELIQTTEKHLKILIALYEKVPEPARKGIDRALEASQRGAQITKEILSGQRREEVREEAEKIKKKTEQGIKGVLKKLWPI